jgi:hypothetical protein
MSLVVVGTVAFDAIETPFGKLEVLPHIPAHQLHTLLKTSNLFLLLETIFQNPPLSNSGRTD